MCISLRLRFFPLHQQHAGSFPSSGRQIQRQDDVKLVFNIGNQVHNRQAVQLQVHSKGGFRLQLNTFFVDRCDKVEQIVSNVSAFAIGYLPAY